MKIFFVCVFVFTAVCAQAQSPVFDSVRNNRYSITRGGTIALGSWGSVNLAGGLIAQANTSGEQRQFYRVTAIAGGVNLALAAAGWLAAGKGPKEPSSVADELRRQSSVEKIFLFNAGLDMAYVVYGLYTNEKAKRYTGDRSERLAGTGKALMVQGGFLTLYDGLLYVLHVKNGRPLFKGLQGVSVGVSPAGFGFYCRF